MPLAILDKLFTRSPMLAYRHLFHAGHAHDVFKHVMLVRLLTQLAVNDKPLCYLDTHAGIGRYDFTHAWALKNAEFAHGIARIFDQTQVPSLIEPYLTLVRAENSNGTLRFYPGSPLLASRLLRGQDRMVLCELNPKDCAALDDCFVHHSNVRVHEMDGIQALKSFLPPVERRGLVLIDSPFDRAQEFTRLAEALAEGHKRWATGVYALWYPLMARDEIARFERRIVASGMRKILRLELSLFGEQHSTGLRGSALLIVNPPWHLDDDARTLLPWLWSRLSPARQGRWSVDWLVPE